ncbi:AAA family ATPase [Pseudoflavitalea sp. X16]|uniref:AAA family ATPase n=1 Tax=Paraflavitalea devenefica TaxID=2716334 RepID=UPI0014218E40|nr:AAA family ATPase [Paraflavitalea devenefica]NII26179.1 AAA family ATPase [Paraflavitalea devenefica]
MKIVSLTIANYRSFGPQQQTLRFDHKLNCFIGMNSAGKTAGLEALKKLFGDTTDRRVSKEDFHVAHDEDPATLPAKKLQIEAKIKFEEKDLGSADFFSDMVVPAPGEDPYIRIRLEADFEPSVTDMMGVIDARLFIIQVAEGEQEDELAKKEFPRFMHQLFQVVYVPALRKTTDQLRYASGSMLHRLLRTVEYSDAFKQEYKEAVEAVNDLFSGLPGIGAIQESLQGLWSRFHKDSRYRDAAMSFGTGEIDEILRKLEISFTPAPGQDRKFGVDNLGDGYRSLFYITLVCTVLEMEDKLAPDTDIEGDIRPLLTLLAVEEPENHIAPQILGRVINILMEIAGNNNTQVFLTSHTPAIVKRLDPEMIFHFQLTTELSTEVNRIELPDRQDDAYKYVKEAVQNFPEIYFARLVLIGEGDSEEVVFNHLTKLLKKDLDDNFITFAPLGHRFVAHIWKLLAKINIPHITLLDLDLGRPGGGWGRVQYALRELIAAGGDRSALLAITDGELSEAEFNDMHNWSYRNMRLIKSWMARLEDYNVYFSYPLDLDFLMLVAYEGWYTAKWSYPDGGGPRIPDQEAAQQHYEKYLQAAIDATLKVENAGGEYYTDEEKALMIWYKYHFLGRGKPVTHLQVLSRIRDGVLKTMLPQVFTDIFKKMDQLLRS